MAPFFVCNTISHACYVPEAKPDTLSDTTSSCDVLDRLSRNYLVLSTDTQIIFNKTQRLPCSYDSQIPSLQLQSSMNARRVFASLAFLTKKGLVNHTHSTSSPPPQWTNLNTPPQRIPAAAKRPNKQTKSFRHSDKHTNIQTFRQTDQQTNLQTFRQTDRQTE
jgi:hypothetical protein